MEYCSHSLFKGLINFAVSCLFASFYTIPANVLSQTCLPSGIIFTSQQEIDDFPSNYPGCTQILGGIDIQGSTITNLDSLIYLSTITGKLDIRNNPNLQDLIGLSNITTIGSYLTLLNCPLLVSLNGLHSLQSVGAHVALFNLPLISSLNQLSNLTSIGTYLSVRITPISNLSGLESITSLGTYLEISFNDSLTSLDGLQNLVSIGGFLIILNNDLLTTLDNLGNLTAIDGDIRIVGNDILTSISGIQNIDPNTISAQGSQFFDLSIFNNPLLSSCDIESVCGLIDITGSTMDIHSNATGCNSIIEVETECQTLPVTWSNELNATIIRSVILLTWSVTNQINNEKFSIERSGNGKHFKKIGTIKGEAFSSDEVNYLFSDKTPLLGLNYYRIKQIDFDGNYQYSNIAVATKQEDKNISVYQNPVTDKVLRVISGYEQGYRLFSINGELLLFGILNEGENLISLSGLDKGCYIIRFEEGTSEKIIVL